MTPQPPYHLVEKPCHVACDAPLLNENSTAIAIGTIDLGPDAAADALAKLAAIRDELNQLFLERAELIDGALAALLSAHHLLVIGPPGTAKSMLADELCCRIAGANYFQWLLTKFSTQRKFSAR